MVYSSKDNIYLILEDDSWVSLFNLLCFFCNIHLHFQNKNVNNQYLGQTIVGNFVVTEMIFYCQQLSQNH